MRIIHDAAVAAGAPAGILGCIAEPSVELSNGLMHHPMVNMILATGGPGMVHAAYSSGKPALGVGAGNTPVVIDETADLKMTISSILMSKTFDNGVICASEQALVVVDSVYEAVKRELTERGAHIVTGSDREALSRTVVQDNHLNTAIVGQTADRIAEMAGIQVPSHTKVLIAECEAVGDGEPFAREKLSPVLALYRASDFNAAVAKARELVIYGGAGHTSVLYTDSYNSERIGIFQNAMVTGRVLINMPASQGAIGDVYNFKLPPSLTLGCGSWGGNSVSENIGVRHLLNVKSVAVRKENMQWYKVPPKIYFKPGALPLAIAELRERKRAFVITDAMMAELGFVDRIVEELEKNGLQVRVFSGIKPDPDLTSIEQCMAQINSFEPDVFVGLGGGSPLDAAKIIWLMYEQPDLKFEDIAMRFMDIRKRIAVFPELGKKAIMVSIPTTSGTGSEVTPFAVITDDRTGIKYPIADYELTPDMAIIDPDLVQTMPPKLAAFTGLDAMTHALESFTSVFANNYTDGQALEALRLIFKYLRTSVHEPQANRMAREKMHYAATIAGMAFSNAFLGVCHSMAHKIGQSFHVPHGLANALLISHVIRYNATDRPTKQGLLPVYRYPFVKGRYARIADHLHLANDVHEDDRDTKVERLIQAIEDLKADLGIPASLREAGVPESDFLAKLDELAEMAFDDQCTGGNPRYPLIDEIKAIYLRAFYGEPVIGVSDEVFWEPRLAHQEGE